MKTHDLADALMQLARLLKAGPNTMLEEFRLGPTPRTSREIAVNIATLARLSQIDKKQWIEFVHNFDLPIDLRPRDASRDIIGKVLRYLDENPDAQTRLKKSAKAPTQDESPELARALTFLLGENN